MTIKGEEFEAVACPMFQDDDGPVIKRSTIVGEGIEGAFERGRNGSSGINEKIDAEMNGAALIGGVGATRKEGRTVNGAGFIVAANSDPSFGPSPGGLQEGSQAGIDGVGRIGAKERARDAEIEYQAVPFPKVGRNDLGGGMGILGEPVVDPCGLRNCGESAGGTKRVVSKTWMNFGEAFESRPRRSFTDRDIRIVRDKGLAMGGVRDADGKACAQQRIKGSNFTVVQRKGFVVSRKDGRSSEQGFLLAEDGVSSRNGRFRDGVGRVHVTEIDDAENAARQGPRR